MGTMGTAITIRGIVTAAFACAVMAANYATAQTTFPLTVVHSDRFTDGAGNTVIIGEVKNNTTHTLSVPKAIVTINGGGTPIQTEVLTSTAGKLSGLFFTYVLQPNETGFFRISTSVPVSSHSVTSEAQQIATLFSMKTRMEVSGTLATGGTAYTLQVTNQGVATIAYNIRSAVAGYDGGGLIHDIDFSAPPGSGGCGVAALGPNGSGNISGSFDRAVSSIKQVALKWDEISVDPIAFEAPSAGGVGEIRVSSECAWTARSNDESWITISSGASGSANGTVRISVAANALTSPRTGTLTVAGLTVRVEQAAGTGTSFTDPQLTSGVTPVRTQHITELRTRIQALRSRFNLAAYPFTDSTLTARVSPVRVVHITQLRLALDEVYAAAKRTPPTYSDSPLTAGMTIKASHISELRAAVLAIE
jgi:hypothetical protein